MAIKKVASERVTRPSILQIAKLTGLSQGAISRAFNGQGGISDATRERILKAAREIGYHPNPSARNFKRGYTKRIGMILPNLSNPNYSELYENLDLVSVEAGYSSILALTHHSAETERDLLTKMSAGESDALIISPIAGEENFDVYKRLKSWRYPVLFIYKRTGNEYDTVGVDYSNSLTKALSYLRDVGHKEVTYVGLSPLASKAIGKHGETIRISKEIGIAYNEELSVPGAPAETAGVQAFAQWRAMGRRPTAVVTYSDQTAIALMNEAKRVGVRIPEDISVLGSDDVASAEFVELSTIRVDRTAMARVIFETVLNRIKDFDSPVRSQIVRSEFLLRGTMGPAPK